MTLEDLSFVALQKIAGHFLQYKSDNPGEFNSENFAKSLPNELRSTYDEIYLFSSSEIEFQNIKLERLILEVKKHALKKQISEYLENIETKPEFEQLLRARQMTLNEVEKKLSTV